MCKDIHPTAIIGYRTQRKIKNKKLFLDKGAKIQSRTVIYEGSKIGKNLETGHNVVIREENKIGDNFSIWSNSVVDYGCKIGDNVKIHCNCYVAQFTTIEDNVFMAPGVTIANDIHPGCEFSKKCMRGPYIEKGVKIGVNATILPFVKIGKNSLIGSASVVTKDVPANSVVYGNPARIIKDIKDLRCVTAINKKGRPY
jgi:acetyltransferase-like isoleucine patch superfamily enzyme